MYSLELSPATQNNAFNAFWLHEKNVFLPDSQSSREMEKGGWKTGREETTEQEKKQSVKKRDRLEEEKEEKKQSMRQGHRRIVRR